MPFHLLKYSDAAPEDAEAADAGDQSGEAVAFDLKEQLASFQAWDSLAFNDRLYSEDENQQRDGNYLVDVTLVPDGINAEQVICSFLVTSLCLVLGLRHHT